MIATVALDGRSQAGASVPLRRVRHRRDEIEGQPGAEAELGSGAGRDGVYSTFHQHRFDAARRQMARRFRRLFRVRIAMTEKSHMMPLGEVLHQAQDAQAFA